MGIFLKKKLDKTSEKNEIVCCSANAKFLFFPASLLLDFVAWDNVFVFIYLYFVSFTYNFQATNKSDHFNPADRLNRPFSSRQISKPGHFPYSIPPDQAVFLSADLQSRPFSTQQTSSPDHFPRSRPQTRLFSTKQTSDQTMTRPPTSQLISQPQLCTERPTSRHPGQIVSLWVGLREVNKNSSG